MSIIEICQWAQDTEIATSLRTSQFAFPLIEGSHVLALAISVGIVMFLDLRLLGLVFRKTPVSRVMQQVGPWMIAGMTIMMLTGFLLFFAQAKNAWVSIFFKVKMILLIMGALNALYYQIKYFPRMADWDLSEKVPAGVKIVAVLSLIFWFGVIICGRTMAYEI